jgi:hypothetical protein
MTAGARPPQSLRSIETQVQRRYGDVGVGLVRAILAERRPLEATERLAGAVSSHEVRSWGWLFRKCLDTIALATGFISSLKHLHRLRRHVAEPANPADDPARHCRRSRRCPAAPRAAEWTVTLARGFLPCGTRPRA